MKVPVILAWSLDHDFIEQTTTGHSEKVSYEGGIRQQGCDRETYGSQCWWIISLFLGFSMVV
jgi:hypothetical protein